MGCAAQEATLRDRFPFHEHASPAHRALVANVVAGPAVEEVERLRRIALSSIDTGTTGGVTGSHWFGTMTVKINLMKTVEDRLAADLVAAAGIIRTQADSELLAVSLLTVLLLALTALISVICVRDITRPLADLSQAMVRLAGNDLETAVPALERRDEFGDMSRALLLFKESGARYRSLIDSAPVGVVIFVHGKIVLANRAAADLFGVESAESLVGKTIAELAHPEEVETAQERLDTIVAEKISAPSAERKIVRADGGIRDVGVRSNYLRWMGYQVVEAEDGPSALTFLKLQAPDLVITDLMMPGGMNGAELARQAKNQHPDLGFIFISGYADAANKVAADLDQGVRVLGKPFSQEDLAAALRDVLDEQRGG